MTEIVDILVVDDDAAIRTVVSAALRRAGYAVRAVGTIAAMRTAMAEREPDVLLSDVVLPDGDGLDVVAALAQTHPALPIIVLSAKNTLSTAVRANEVGAFDYLPKPFDLDKLAETVDSALGRGGEPLAAPDLLGDDANPLIGRSPAMQEVYRVIARIVPNDLTVLVTGESGTGKELVARAIHDLGPRRHAPFIALNMAAIPRELIEAELFGHERGAFTGAQARSAGKFEQASGGTLFLDEIGDMPMEAQTRLLRVLQSGEFTTVGGARTIRADVRIVAATNKDLAGRVADGQFREDLFYRLNVVPVALPPLRQRPEDIVLLARHFLDKAAQEGLPRKRIDRDVAPLLERHSWPGNVRELENLMRRAAVLARDEAISAGDLRPMLGEATAAGTPPLAEAAGIAAAVRARLLHLHEHDPRALDDGTLYNRIIAEVERPLIEAMLERNDNNQLRAARALGINRNTLRKRLQSFGML
ncbi:nitrogen regulation protein NR(I) [Stakelama saccharophila]|uniref:DNA-binding transcriptional regulator NtrC n=1 Tax=Stakelama saccharophila TaxID=3075605 RepID=A0ABZ0B877_9SPHN|nr:nitrogen regulation protein NR(I) [Stakelama sp. W311]WNO52539.1 nitrogen regulation protein NR(I) [Stakelama sp. W311]